MAPPQSNWFAFSELCLAQDKLNGKASVSPLTPIPTMLLKTQDMVWRCCLLCLLNLVLLCRALPAPWTMAPIAPIPKPLKDLATIEGYRQISLLAPLFKLLDKLLHFRINPVIKSATSLWQFGGCRGADEAAWFLTQLLQHCVSRGRRHIWIAFLDAESAFTRPAPAFILRAFWDAGVRGTDWLAIHSILGNLKGCLKVGSRLHRAWRVRCGVPQGGALSLCLFAVILIELYNALQAAGCGVTVVDEQGCTILVSLIAFVDDLALLADSPEKLQIALDIVAAWARHLRIRLNIGPTKSAIMVWGKGRQPAARTNIVLRLGEHFLPYVSTYKYMGVRIASSGSWFPHFQYMADKVKSKPSEIVAWARRYEVILPVVVRLWELYVHRAVTFGAVICEPTRTDTQTLDRAQRQAGRRILGFRRSVPGPAILADLGWNTFSTDLTFERAAFLGRVCTIANSYMQAILEASSLQQSSWVALTVLKMQPWCGQATPEDATEWKRIVRSCKRDAQQIESHSLGRQCQLSGALASYSIPRWRCEKLWMVNNFMHNKDVKPRLSRQLSRLLTAGQDLRGGDPVGAAVPNVSNCCIPCLENGIKCPETLQHVCFECPAYTDLRSIEGVQEFINDHCLDIFCLHRHF